MNRSFLLAPKRLLIAAALAGLGSAALAQGASPSSPAASAPAPTASAAHAQHARRAPPTPEQWHQHMAEQHARHLAALKAALNLTPDQQGAWSQFETAMQPPAPPQPPQPGEWAKLTTPERVDQMQQRADEREQHFKQVGDAVKAFYAQLTPAQQKTFDQRTAHLGPHGEHVPFGPHGKPGAGAHAPASAASHAHSSHHPAASRPAAAASQAN